MFQGICRIFLLLFLCVVMMPRALSAEPMFVLILLHEFRAFTEYSLCNSRNRDLVIRQTTPITCGSSALATLFTFYFDDPTTEKEIAELSGALEIGKPTMAGLHDAANKKGYKTVGYRMTLPQLERELATRKIPVIVHLVEPTYHFSLATGIIDGFVLLSDPSRGNVMVPTTDFLRQWSGNTLVVRDAPCPGDITIVPAHIQSVNARMESLSIAGKTMFR